MGIFESECEICKTTFMWFTGDNMKICCKCVNENKIMETREQIKSEIKKLKRKLKEFDEKPVDGWYVIPNFDYKNWMAYFVDGIMVLLLNKGELRVISETIKFTECNPLKRLATPEEVTKRLTEFVNGRGYVEGVNVKWCNNWEVVRFEFNANPIWGHVIYYGGLVIWSSIKGWAKIIEEPNYKVEVTRVEKSGTITIEIQHSKEADSKDLAKEIETFLNEKK